MNASQPRRVPRALWAILLSSCVADVAPPAPAQAQCQPQWVTGNGIPGVDGPVNALALRDPDGPGPMGVRVVAGGSFALAGGHLASRVGAWDPGSGEWSAFGEGMTGTVSALLVLPDGDLVAGGSFLGAGDALVNRIARWHEDPPGSGLGAWSAFGSGMNDEVLALATMPNGDIVAGGVFTTTGGATINRIARWNGSEWLPFGSGMPGIVFALGVLPNGDVMAGGAFGSAGGVTVLYIARWDSAEGGWHALQLGLNGWTRAILVLPEGDPEGQVIAGGSFTTTENGLLTRFIARWSGTAWSLMGTGMNARVLSLARTPAGEIVAGGQFSMAGGAPANMVARWNGASWQALGTGLGGALTSVNALAVLPGGDIIAGGTFLTAGGAPSAYLARWTQPTPPVIESQPGAAAVCPGGAASFSIGASGGPLAYRWQRNGTDLFDEPNHIAGAAGPVLRLVNTTDGDVGEYRCIVSTPCGVATSDEAALVLCRADFNCDGAINSQDFFDFLTAFFAGGLAADYNRDGAVNSQDFFDFLSAFFAGC